jgi:hypothetical protein
MLRHSSARDYDLAEKSIFRGAFCQAGRLGTEFQEVDDWIDRIDGIDSVQVTAGPTGSEWDRAIRRSDRSIRDFVYHQQIVRVVENPCP